MARPLDRRGVGRWVCARLLCFMLAWITALVTAGLLFKKFLIERFSPPPLRVLQPWTIFLWSYFCSKAPLGSKQGPMELCINPLPNSKPGLPWGQSARPHAVLPPTPLLLLGSDFCLIRSCTKDMTGADRGDAAQCSLRWSLLACWKLVDSSPPLSGSPRTGTLSTYNFTVSSHCTPKSLMALPASTDVIRVL